MNENPFRFSKPVKGEDFHNRKEEIERILGFIKGMQCFSIVGERRIGKTSVLEHVLSKGFLMEHGLDLNDHIIVRFSMAELHKITKERFVGKIVKKMEQYVQIETTSADIFENLMALVDELTLNNRRIIIALDEFELSIHILDDNFLFWLRNILQKPNIMAITASRTTIRALSDDKPASPLYNIFMNITLGLFSEEETEKMITEIFQKGDKKLNKDEISFLSDLSGGNPYFIQLIGYYYYEERKKDEEVSQEEFKNEVLNQLKDIFENFWDHLNEEEKIILYNPKKIKNNQTSYNLKKKGFIIEKSGELRIFSPLFEEFIKSKIQNYLQVKIMEKRKEEEEEKPKKKIEEKRKIRFSFAAIMSISAFLIVIILSISIFADSILIIFAYAVLTSVILALFIILRRQLNE
jgi:hypothetical protein